MHLTFVFTVQFISMTIFSKKIFSIKLYHFLMFGRVDFREDEKKKKRESEKGKLF